MNSIALGNGSGLWQIVQLLLAGQQANGADAIALGNGSQSSGLNAIALGKASVVTGDNSLALGSNTNANGINSVALGAGSIADQDDSVSVGSDSLQRKIVNVKMARSRLIATTPLMAHSFMPSATRWQNGLAGVHR